MRARLPPVGLCVAALSAATVAAAQSLSGYFPPGVPGYNTEEGVTVQTRERPLYDPIGTRVGSYIVRPNLDQSFAYDDNVFGGSNSPGSWIVRTNPSVAINSDWSQNSLNGYLGLDNYRYLDTPSQSRTNWVASLGGSVRIGNNTITLAASHFSLHQDRTDLDALPSDTPIAYQVEDVRVADKVDLGRITVTPGLDAQYWHFDNTTIFGVPSSQAYRDRDVLEGTVTTRYELASLRSLVLVLEALDSHYTEPPAGAPSRNSTGYLALAGIDYELDGMWRYRLLGGYELRDFSAPQYAAHGAPIAEADVTFMPSGLTTITGRLTRSIEDAAQEGVSGYTYTSAKLMLDHEYLRNVLLHAHAGIECANYLQGGGTETSFGLGAGVTWLVNQHVRVSASYSFTNQTSTDGAQTLGGSHFTRNVYLLTLGFAR